MVWALLGLLAMGGAAPLVVAFVQPQPQDATVAELADGSVEQPEGWVRLRGRVVALSESPTGGLGEYGLLVDAVDPLRAVVLLSDAAPAETDITMVTGHLLPALVAVKEQLPIEATVAGAPPRVVADRLVSLDPTPYPERAVLWPVAAAALLLAAVLAIGLRAGYPVFRPTHEVDVLSQPLAPGERLPAAVSGRVGIHIHPLEDPAEAMLLVGRGPRGGILIAQLLPHDGPAPPPVQIGGGWTSGRVGYVYTVEETVPALQVRSDRADAIILFARVGERDRAAALVALDR